MTELLVVTGAGPETAQVRLPARLDHHINQFIRPGPDDDFLKPGRDGPARGKRRQREHDKSIFIVELVRKLARASYWSSAASE